MNPKLLVKQAEQGDSISRISVLEIIGRKRIKSRLPVLYRALKDKDPLIRVQAVESLGWLKNPNSVVRLKMVLRNDPNELARAYAATAIGDIRKYSVSALETALLRERNALVLSHIYGVLVKSGKSKYLMALYALMSHSRYHVRCSVANCLAELPGRSIADLSVRWLALALRHETTGAGRSSIRNSIKELHRRYSV